MSTWLRMAGLLGLALSAPIEALAAEPREKFLVPDPTGIPAAYFCLAVFSYHGCWFNDRYPICKRTLHEAPANDRFWPKADLRERRESTQNGHSSWLTRTSAIGSLSGRSIAPLGMSAISRYC